MLCFMILFGLIVSSYCIPCSCDKKSCKPLTNCKFGMVKDGCNCCQVCAKGVGESCGGRFNVHGICADDLECVYSRSLTNLEKLKRGGTCIGA
ncbi:venom protein 302-like [Centruroides sculpturatus]|uniref:venom protein 302-like n=1 Tax=Centruroides sculpturatus TaxID=218467 RepID=UPI000C6E3610|nr:venom protein 302-like [Centruroides sculpturatus]